MFKVTSLKRIFCLIMFCLVFSMPSLNAQQKVMGKSDVKNVMEDLFVYHVQYKQMQPEVMKRAFYFYIEQFDIIKGYLTEQEVETYLNPSSQMLSDAVDRYHNHDLYYFEQLQVTIQGAIVRARQNRADFKSQVEKNVTTQNYSTNQYELGTNYPRNEGALIMRQQSHMERFIYVQEKSSSYVVTYQDYQKMFIYYENRMREFESNHYIDPSLQNAEELQEHKVTLHALKAFARSLDAHSAFYSPEEIRGMQSSLSKGFYGIGLVLQRDYRGITVREILKDGPAAKISQIQEGDEIVAINNKKLDKLEYREVVELLEGGANTQITLTIRKGGSSSTDVQSVTVNREKVALSSRMIESSIEPYEDGIIGKITLNSFYNNQQGSSSASDMKRAIEAFKQQGNLKGIVLDLRQNTGGFLVEAVEVAGLFITNGVVVAAKFSDGKIHYLRDLNGKVTFSGPLVILTSRLTASSSEITAGSLQDYGRAVIVGDPRTFGKGSIQYQTLTLPKAKHYYKVTIGRYYTVSGKSPQLEGVKADIMVPSCYYKERLGEQYLTHALEKDSIEPAYVDPLSDLDPKAKEIFQKFYMPTIQKKSDTWAKAMPELKKNSTRRLSKNPEFQAFMKQMSGEGSSNYELSTDVQMEEAVYVLKDMIQIQNKTSQKEKAAA